MKVLIAEDDPISLRLLEAALQCTGHRVVKTHNGEEALEALTTGDDPPRLAILDWMMPRMDGFEFLDRLRSQERGRAVPVIVLTAKVLTPEEERLLHTASTAIIQKGKHDMELLLDAVGTQLRKTG